MSKIEITIVVPSVGPFDAIPVIRNYLSSDSRDRFDVQFIVLMNSKRFNENDVSRVDRADNCEVWYISNDRYYGSCEENISRVEGFSGNFKDLIFCVGEHDVIDWTELARSVAYFRSKDLGAMGWDIVVKQKYAGGRTETKGSFSPINGGRSSRYVNMLLGGCVLPSDLAYSSILSSYGPMDWAAYLGNHLYKKDVFLAILNYTFKEKVYSFVFQQATYFSTRKIRYGLYVNCVIQRVSSDFDELINKIPSAKISWLQEHRLVRGRSNVFHVAILSHLIDIDNRELFNLISGSLCLSHIPNQDGSIGVIYSSLIAHMIEWSKRVLVESLVGRSMIFPSELKFSSNGDMEYVRKFLIKMLNCLDFSCFSDVGNALRFDLLEVATLLESYMEVGFRQDDVINRALELLIGVQGKIKPEHFISLNDNSFGEFLVSGTKS